MNQSRAVLLILVITTLSLATLLVLPFVEFVLLALLLAYVVYPLQRRLTTRIGAGLSAFLLVIVVTLAIVLPVFLMVAIIAQDAIQFVEDLDPSMAMIDQFDTAVETWTGMSIDSAESIRGSVEGVVGTAFGPATDLFGAFLHSVVGIGVAGFLLFFLLKDGDALASWIQEMLPLPDPVQYDLYHHLDGLIWAVVVGHVVVAIIQGVLAGLGLWIAGVPNALFWTMVMIFLALIPLVGSFLVWAPAAGWLVMTGSTLAGGLLFVYGLVIVGTSDEFLRPLIVGRSEISPSVIIVGVIGGMYVLGVIGLFVGPIIVGAVKGVVETYDEWFSELEPADR